MWRRVLAATLVVTGALACALVPGPVAVAAPAAPGIDGRAPADRYAPAGGCWSVRAIDGRGAGLGALVEPHRFVATDLGRYLLVRPDGTVLAADHDAVVRAARPSSAAEWELRGPTGAAFSLHTAAEGRPLVVEGDGALTVGPAGAAPTALRLEGGERCAPWPDVDTGVTGPHATGGSPIDEVRGYLDSHLHLTGYELLGGRAHCGRPWHRYGVAFALVDCPDHEVAGGRVAVLENLLGSGVPIEEHDPVGWPTFRDWPAHDSLTHEQTYHRWVERAWRGGLRMIVQLFTDNRVLCELYPLKDGSCDEMDSVRRQAAGMRALERYVDAQHGGPGRGWLRIVDDPAEARRTMNAGQLAVVLGIEVSEPFGCRAVADQPRCTFEEVQAELDELVAMGIRQVFLIHKSDNAMGGVTGDGGYSGLFTNPGNLLSTGHLLEMETCPESLGDAHDNTQDLPGYPPPPHCNVRGLSDLGARTVQAAAARGLLLDLDHMSVRARSRALDLLEARRYSGVVSSHGWADSEAVPRILRLGGVVSPYAGGSAGFVGSWEQVRAAAAPGYLFGLGYGADNNGLGTQGGPRRGPNPVTYPFAGFGGTTISRQVTGERTFDVNRDGVAHYGLYPDWIEDLRRQAGDPIVADLERGPEAYLQMWERAAGLVRHGDGCLAPGASAAAVAARSADEVTAALGQPQRRTPDSFVYCDGVVRFDGAQRAVALEVDGHRVAIRALAAAAWGGAGAVGAPRA